MPEQEIPAIFALSKESLKEVWRYSPPDTEDLSRLVQDERKTRLLMATRSGDLLAVDTTNGRPTLLRKGLPRDPLAFVQADGALIWITPTGALRLDPERYNTTWELHENLGIKSRVHPTGRVNSVYPYQARVVGQRLYLPAEGMRLLEIDVADGRISETYDLPENTDPRLYLFTREGIIYGTRETGTKGSYRHTDLTWLDLRTSQRRTLYTGEVSAMQGDHPLATDHRNLYVAARDEIVAIPLPNETP